MGPPLKRGNKVYLLRKHIKTKRPSTKLKFKKFGPYKILEKIKPINFKLQLPKRSRLHLIFHISLLKPTSETTPLAINKEIQPENNPNVYEVKKLLNIRITNNGQQEYLIK